MISLHVPKPNAKQWMIDEAQIAAMKPGSVLIIASRGTVVRIEALAEALRQRKLLGSAINVPGRTAQQQRRESPLRAFDNVFLTPHVGGSTMELLRHPVATLQRGRVFVQVQIELTSLDK